MLGAKEWPWGFRLGARTLRRIARDTKARPRRQCLPCSTYPRVRGGFGVPQHREPCGAQPRSPPRVILQGSPRLEGSVARSLDVPSRVMLQGTATLQGPVAYSLEALLRAPLQGTRNLEGPIAPRLEAPPRLTL